MKYISGIALSLCLLSCLSTEGDSASETLAENAKNYQYQRFAVWINGLAEVLSTESDSKKAAALLVKGQHRVEAFNLQALGKLYRGIDKDFDKLRKDFKELEDGIGEYKKWRDIGKKKEQEQALKEFSAMLDKKDWVGKTYKKTKLYKIDQLLKNHDFSSYRSDKKAVAAELQKQVDDLRAKKFDLGILEDDYSGEEALYGLHELRRELRWFLIEARVLNGMVQFKSERYRCPIKLYQDISKTYQGSAKYAVLPDNEPRRDSCKISRCLFLAINQHVGTLGDLKDLAEKDDEARATNKVPEQFVEKAVGVYSEITNNNLLDALSAELNTCSN